MFDEVRCRYPLPFEIADDVLLQTKSLDCRMDLFEVREDGSLWREIYDTEDRSDPNAEGLMAIVGCMTRVNKRWEREPYTGELSVTHWTGEPPLRVIKLWFRDGMIRDVAAQLEPLVGPDVVTFGEVESPATDVIDVKLGEDFQCPCGCVMNLGGACLAAHWDEKLQRTCDKCGQLFLIRSGRLKLSRKVGKYGSPKHVFGT